MTAESDEFIRRCLTDTGFVCRQLLGWNYDEGALNSKQNVGTGGVRPTGAHQQMVGLLDDETTRYKMIQAPRGSYKSAVLQGYIVKLILRNPDIRIFYIAATDAMAREKAVAIRRILESDRVTQHFGPQVGEPWEAERFTVAGIQDVQQMNCTFSAWSVDHMPTGGRAHVIICDDIIDEKDHTNPEMMQKSKDAFTILQPFLAVGGTMVVVGTRWDDDDLLNDLEQNVNFAPPLGRKLILGAGVRVVTNQHGHLDLEELPGGVTFPHLSLQTLREKFNGMVRKGDARMFILQYLNEVPPMSGSEFKRQHFQPLGWGNDMRSLSGYLLTDTATSLRDQGCYSALAYVGIDHDDSLYLLDANLGHWDQDEFVRRFFDMLERWRNRVNHCGEVWEAVALAQSYHYSIKRESLARKAKLNPLEVSRSSAESKHQRIKRMFVPMQRRTFWVVDTVPKEFQDLSGTRTLFDPRGHVDARTKEHLPSGELVDQFLRLGQRGVKNDLADAIGMILECERRDGQLRRYCQYRKPPTPQDPRRSLTSQRQMDYGLAYRRESSQIGQEDDWWTKTLKQLDA